MTSIPDKHPMRSLAHDGFRRMARCPGTAEERADVGQPVLAEIEASGATPEADLAAAALQVRGPGRETAYHYALLLASRGVEGPVGRALGSAGYYCSMMALPPAERILLLRPFVERMADHTEDPVRSALAKAALAVEGKDEVVAAALIGGVTVAARKSPGTAPDALLAAAEEAEHRASWSVQKMAAGAPFRAAATVLGAPPASPSSPSKATEPSVLRLPTWVDRLMGWHRTQGMPG